VGDRTGLWLSLLGVAFAGCTENSRAQACIPIDGQGCDAPTVCTLDADGEPVCLTPTATAGDAFDPCASPDACSSGHACIVHDGRAQCLRLCAPEGGTGAETCSALGEGVLCVSVIDTQPEIGVCVATCVDPTVAACPDLDDGQPAGCWLVVGFDVALTLLRWQDANGLWGTGHANSPRGWSQGSSHAFALLTLEHALGGVVPGPCRSFP
jgi:hypothetical protein